MIVTCTYCNTLFHKSPSQIAKTKNNFCSRSHAASYNNAITPKRLKKEKKKKERTKKVKPYKPYYYILALTKTKAEVFHSERSWQAARSIVQQGARFIFRKLNPDMKCQECGYSNHVEVCHIKSVASFPPDTPLYQVNHIRNLVGLCPNHHWEFDNGILHLDGMAQS